MNYNRTLQNVWRICVLPFSKIGMRLQFVSEREPINQGI